MMTTTVRKSLVTLAAVAVGVLPLAMTPVSASATTCQPSDSNFSNFTKHC